MARQSSLHVLDLRAGLCYTARAYSVGTAFRRVKLCVLPVSPRVTSRRKSCRRSESDPAPLGSWRPGVVHRGEIPEWPKGTDCKSVAERFGGSNPPLPTLGMAANAVPPAHIAQRQSTSLVKKRSWVRFPVWAGTAPILGGRFKPAKPGPFGSCLKVRRSSDGALCGSMF